MKNKIIDSFS